MCYRNGGSIPPASTNDDICLCAGEMVSDGDILTNSETTNYTNKPFAEAFAELMRAKYGDEMGNFDLRPVLSQVHGYSYEALRLMLRGERTLKMEAIEGIAEVLGVSPHYFAEYRVMWSAEMAKRYPDLGEMVYSVVRRFLALREGGEFPNDLPPSQN